ncbi:MAG: 3-hydroxybutyrate oligomer hydrolase family protein [Acidobacteriota bacterium]
MPRNRSDDAGVRQRSRPDPAAADHRNDRAGEIYCDKFGEISSDIDTARLLEGVSEIQLTARLKNTPAIIVQGRSDTLLPVNETSRAYYGKNQLTQIGATQLRYIEVTNGQHFDTFIDLLPGFSQLYIPVHVYLQRALNAMYDHLKNGTPLPPSQVVRTTPRGPVTPPFTTLVATPITAANVPPISPNPLAGDLIQMQKTTLLIPD